MRRFEFSEGSSNKFWEIELTGSSFTVSWGKIGTAGQTQVKDFASDAKALAEHDKLIKEKMNKGYAEVSGGATTSAPTAAPVVTPAKATPVAPKAVKAPVAPSPAPSTSSSAPAVTPAAPSAPADSSTSASSPAPIAPADFSADPQEVVWDPEGYKEVHPSRAFNPLPLRIDPKKTNAALEKYWNEAVEQLKKHVGGGAGAELSAALAAAQRRIPSSKLKVTAWTDPSDVSTEAALYHIFAHHRMAKPEATEALMDQWVQVSPGFALDCLVRAEELAWEGDYDKPQKLTSNPTGHSYRYYTFESNFLLPALRLRSVLASTDQGTWDATWAHAQQYASQLKLQELIAYLFPDSGFADTLTSVANMASLSIRKAEHLNAAVTVASSYNFSFRTGTSWRSDSAPWETCYTWLANTGSGCVPSLCRMMDETSGEWPKAAAEVCARIPTDEALKALFSRLENRNVVPGAQAAANRFPVRSLHMLATIVSGRTKVAGPAQIMLTQLLRQDVARFTALAPTLPESPRKVVLATLEKLGPMEDALPEELHRILISPPWLAKKQAVAAKVVAVSPLPYAASVTWAEGERERILEDAGQPEDPKNQSKIKEKLKNLSFDTDLAPLALGDDPKAKAAWEQEKAKEQRWKWEGYLLSLPPRLALLFWNELPPTAFYGDAEKSFSARYQLEGLPGLLSRVGRNAEKLDLLLGYDHPDVGVLAAETLAFRKKGKALADKWLRLHPEAGIVGLLPTAVGKTGKARDAAENGLRVIAGHGKRPLILEVAGRYGNPAVIEAVEAVLATDPLDQVPNKVPKMPDFWVASSFSRPRVKGSNRALPVSAVEALGTMLAFSQLESPYGGLSIVKEMCTPESLGDFAWDLFHAWNFAGAPSKEGWAFRQLGFLGNDDCARKLAPLIRQWPGESQHQRAVTGLDILASIGTDVALMHLNGIAQKVKFKGLQEAAREKIQFIAEARGLSPEELADRLVPDLGLDERGTLTLDFGPRQFQVGFDEALRPNVRDSEGKVLPDLPKPKQSDDAEKSAAAVDTWKALKKDVKTLASQQLVRLEVAMCSRRRWNEEVFRLFLAGHPLVGHLVRRLIWGAYAEDGSLVTCFRVAEDGSFADGDDGVWELPPDLKIGVAHALEIPTSEAAKFGQVLADYEILQPFRQLGRETYALTPEEKAANNLSRFNKTKVPTGKILGLDGRGWRRGPPQDAGLIWWFVRPIPMPGYEIHMGLDPGIAVGMIDEFPEQTIDGISIVRTGAYSWGNKDGELTMGSLDPITASELIRELEGIRG